jgi:hypothetical protein
LTRLLASLAIAPLLAISAVAFASCDTGGEPPEVDGGADVGVPDVPLAETPIVTQQDSSAPSVDGGTGAVSDAGTSGNGCSPACALDEACVDGGCVACGGGAGEPCCSPLAEGGTCNGAASLVCVDSGFCAPCGGPGQSCCGLNTCGDGGCCGAGTCASEGDSCQGVDGGTCQAGACGGPSGCGGLGGPCCATWCTAPQTLCEGSGSGTVATEAGSTTTLVPGQCHECGNGGEPCCNGSSCQSSLSCNGSGVCVQ